VGFRSTLNALVQSAELRQVLAQSAAIASESGQPHSSAHVLLALFTVPNLAAALLAERSVDEQYLLGRIDRIEREPEDTLRQLATRAGQVAKEYGDRQVDCLHLLAALTRMTRSFACRLLERADVDVVELRRIVLHVLIEGVPPRMERRTPAADTTEMNALAGPGTSGEGQTLHGETLHGETPHADPLEGRESVTVSVAATTTTTSSQHRAQQSRGPERRRTGRRASDRSQPPAASPPALGARAGRALPEDAPSPFVLNRERFRFLNLLGRNLSHLAWLDRIDPVLGRDAEVEACIDILNKRRSNNPCLIGDPGVGKTAIAEGIALRLVQEHKRRGGTPERVIIQIDVGAILAGTHLRGSLAERLRGLQDEVRQADGAVVVFIDELHTLIGAGGGDGAHDAANELKAALARGQFPCIGATTVEEFRKHVETDAALERRFTPVYVEEPDVPTTVRILEGVVDRYAAHHTVEYAPESLESAVRLGRRYLHERRDPDRALNLLDLAGAIARRETRRVDRRTIAQVVSRTARVPLEHLVVDDPQRYLQMEARLALRIVGQRPALEAIGETIRRNLAGFAGRRPVGSFLFLGPTGVGKTEVVKALAEFLFGNPDALLRFDMSEFLESHSVSRLIGAPPGYVGHADGGQLTESIRRRPYQVVLFDEIEKSHREVWNLLLQVLDEGRLTDGRGRTIDFSNTVVVLTSNLGAEIFNADAERRRIGFGAPAGDADDARAATRDAVLAKARGSLPPELWNRIESRVVFHPLSQDEVRAVAGLLLRERARLLEAERGIGFRVSEAAVDILMARGGFDARLGARPMRQTIAREIEGRLAEKILSGEVRRGDRVFVDTLDGELFVGIESA
jgi:ATP-dependent Clp protease ATP-binding subunit ClpC